MKRRNRIFEDNLSMVICGSIQTSTLSNNNCPASFLSSSSSKSTASFTSFITFEQFQFLTLFCRTLPFPDIPFLVCSYGFFFFPAQPQLEYCTTSSWHPIFISSKGILMTNDSVMLDDDAAAAVANNILIPRDAKLLGDRSIVEAINNSLAFSTQGSASLSP